MPTFWWCWKKKIKDEGGGGPQQSNNMNGEGYKNRVKFGVGRTASLSKGVSPLP